MPTTPKLSTALTWLVYLLPVYIFVVSPALRALFPTNEVSGAFDWPDQDKSDEYELVPGINVTDDRFISPEDNPRELQCREDDYRVHILSRSPLVIYIENFLSESEADHLTEVSKDRYAPSIVYDGMTERVDPSVRLSDRALLDRDDVVRCLEERARAFQGWRPFLYIERMWAQRYNVSGHYRHHYDWTGNGQGADRVSTFMVYLKADCTGGGTNFPRLRKPLDKKWCRFIECDAEPQEEGVTFKPIKGNAIFWENLRADGTGYPETWHAALPVRSGEKVGLNIWSWYQPPIRKRKSKTKTG